VDVARSNSPPLPQLNTYSDHETAVPSQTRIAIGLAALAVLSSCSSISGETQTITVLTHDSFHVSQESLDAYTERTGVRVAVIREPDAEAVVDLLARTAANPIADVVVGIDSLSVAKVIRQRLVLSHRAIEADRLDPKLLVDDDELTPISYNDICLNVDLTAYEPPPPTPEELAAAAAFAAAEAEAAAAAGEEPVVEEEVEPPPPLPDPPATILTLTEAIYFGEVVIPDPATDRIGQYFVVALQHRFGEGSIDEDGVVSDAWTTVLDRLVRNGMSIVPSWREAYFGNFTQGNFEGQQTVVLASAQMPAVTASLRLDPPDKLETAVINDACIRVVNYAGIVAGTRERRSAGRFIDQMITPEFQFNLIDGIGSRPARADLIINELFDQYAPEVEYLEIDPIADSARLAEWVFIFGAVVEDARAPVVVEDDSSDTTAASG